MLHFVANTLPEEENPGASSGIAQALSRIGGGLRQYLAGADYGSCPIPELHSVGLNFSYTIQEKGSQQQTDIIWATVCFVKLNDGVCIGVPCNAISCFKLYALYDPLWTSIYIYYIPPTRLLHAAKDVVAYYILITIKK